MFLARTEARQKHTPFTETSKKEIDAENGQRGIRNVYYGLQEISCDWEFLKNRPQIKNLN